MRKLARLILVTLAGGLILAIAAGVIGEFFIELARERGWYDSPSQRLDAMMEAFSVFVTQTWFLVLTGVTVGIAIGAWLDLFFRRRETVAPIQEVPPDAAPLREVVGKIFRQERVQLDGTRFIKCIFASVTFVYNGCGFKTDRCRFEGPFTYATDTPEIENYLFFLNDFRALRPTTEDSYGPVEPTPELHFVTRDGKEVLIAKDVDSGLSHFEDARIRMIKTFPQITQNKTFVRCDLIGPANIAFGGDWDIRDTKLVNCDFLWFDENKPPINIMIVAGSTIDNCALIGLTLFVRERDKNKLEQSFPGQIPWLNKG